jgi:uncharacterized glyoxalase superfamily protein PhnB
MDAQPLDLRAKAVVARDAHSVAEVGLSPNARGLSHRRRRDTGGVARSEPRAGYRSVTPRLVVEDVEAQVMFLRDVFAAAGAVEPGRPAEVRIGDSVVMISSTAEREPIAAFLYVYVDDADEAFQRAVAAGATVLEEPLNTPYGDRRAMVRDPFGNIFQIAHPVSHR